MAKRVTVVRVCVLEQEVGLWCDDCQTNGRYIIGDGCDIATDTET